MTKLEAINEMLMAAGMRPVAALDTSGGSEAAIAERLLDRESKRIQAMGWNENKDPAVTIAIPTDTISYSVAPVGTFVAGETVTETGSGATGRFHYLSGGKVYLTNLSGTFTGGAVLATLAATVTGVTRAAITSGEIAVSSDMLAVVPAESDGYRDLIVRNGLMYDRDNDTSTFDADIQADVTWLLSFATLSETLAAAIATEAKVTYYRQKVKDRPDYSILAREANDAMFNARKNDAAQARSNMLNGNYARTFEGRPGYIPTR